MRPADVSGGASGAFARRVRHALSVVAANAANILTVARLCCALPIVLLVRAGDYHQAALVFLLAAASDGARRLHRQAIQRGHAFGTVLDPVADKLLMDSLFLTLAFEGHLPPWIAGLVIARDLLIVAGTLALRYLAGRFRVEPLLLGKVSTFMQIVLGGAVLLQLSVLPGLLAWLQPLVVVTAVSVRGLGRRLRSVGGADLGRWHACRGDRRAVGRGRATSRRRRASWCWTCPTPRARGSRTSCPRASNREALDAVLALARLAGARLPADRPARPAARRHLARIWARAGRCRVPARAPSCGSRRSRCGGSARAACVVDDADEPAAGGAAVPSLEPDGRARRQPAPDRRSRRSPAGACACPICARGC